MAPMKVRYTTNQLICFLEIETIVGELQNVMSNLTTGFKQVSKIFLKLLQSLEIKQTRTQQLKPLKQMEKLTPIKSKKLSTKWRITEDEIKNIHDIGCSGNMTAFAKRSSELFHLDMNEGIAKWVNFLSVSTYTIRTKNPSSKRVFLWRKLLLGATSTLNK
jgi:hypothetical protein